MTADVPIRPAATVVVLRDGAEGVEVFLVRRTFSIAFMAGAHVFPGGRVDDADADVSNGWCDLPPTEATARGPSTLAFAAAAARELFEEAGILLARHAGGAFIALEDVDTRHRFERYRHSVHAGTATLRSVVAGEGLRLALDAVVPFAHWVTPPIEVRRFDTWFFMTRVPPRQHATHDEHESMDSGWFRPEAALHACRGGHINLPPPTWATLRELERFESTTEALAWAASCRIVDRQPRVIERGKTREIVLPGDPAHPDADSPAFETRFVWVDGRWLPDVLAR